MRTASGLGMGRPTVAASSLLLLSVTALITLTDANTVPVISSRSVQLREDIPEGHYAFTINATDRDFDKLHYALSGINARFFSVNEDTGHVSIRSPLDREAHITFMTVMEVNDGFNQASQTLIVILQDANDNPPIFQYSPYNAEVKENALLNTSVLNVTATDTDDGLAGSVRYKIVEVNSIPGAGNLFTIGERSGEVRLNGSLDFSLSTFYRLKINASDGGGDSWHGHVTKSAITYAFIRVVDVANLDPEFLALPYRGPVNEGASMGTTVLTVTAIDPDSEISDTILYSIEKSSSHPNLFAISETTGAISVQSEIDREAIGDNSPIKLTVKATEANLNVHGEEASTTAEVQISIEDINDNKPLFYSCGITCVQESQFRGMIFENSAGSVQINMTVEDLDQVQNAQIKLEVEGVDKDAFAVTPIITTSQSRVQLVVQDPQQLDFERKKEMVVQVIAIDMENTTMRSTATVTIQILDLNDNSPTFEKITYKLVVSEHSADGTEVDVITANDVDSMDQGKLTYRLLPESIRKYFDVKLHTGEVYVTNSTLIDREVMSLYSATLQARDTNNNTGTTVLEISLTDINDKPPVINRDSYMVFVQEGKQFELQIEATDADDPETDNSKIVFAIIASEYSDNFTIDPNTGMLKNSGVLDREAIDPKMKGRIELIVTATDRGTPALATSVKVIINVEDINDNEPVFEKASYDFSVKEGAKGAFVGSVQAKDLDQALDFNRISFSILNGSFASFIIRTFVDGSGYRGDITVDPDTELDYESLRNHFMLWVEAADLSQGKAEVMVNIAVLDVNDERPEFQPLDTVKVDENSTGFVGNFSALDKDGNHFLVYHMVSCKCRCNTTLISCDWMLLDNQGAVTVNPDVTLDYEQCDQVQIMAQVLDERTEKGENNSVSPGEMVVDIVDKNDNAPEFLNSDKVFVLVSETANKGTSVAHVTAIDHDGKDNNVITFQVTEVKFEDPNSVVSSIGTVFLATTVPPAPGAKEQYYGGRIESNEELDSSLKGKYLVTVTATDGGLSTSTELQILIVDKSFKIELLFESPVADVKDKEASITAGLSFATRSAVYVVSIKPDTATSRAPGDTLMELYFVYRNGTAISSDSVEKTLSSPEHHDMLQEYGIVTIGSVDVIQAPPDPLRYVLLGLVGGLIIVLTVLATSLVCTRRSYRTKLKAAKAMKSTTMAATDNQRGGPVVPGTNKYTMEGANPVLNLNIDAVTDLGFDEDSSNIDRISETSFDDGMSLHSEKETGMMVIQEEDEEALHIEPLGAALAQRARRDAGISQKGFTNPAFSHTDL